MVIDNDEKREDYIVKKKPPGAAAATHSLHDKLKLATTNIVFKQIVKNTYLAKKQTIYTCRPNSMNFLTPV